MPLIGIIAKKKDIQAIRKKVEKNNYEIIEINKESICNLKNIQFEVVVFLQGINLKDNEYKYMKDIISKAKYIIINADLKIETLQNIEVDKPIKLITFGFNPKATITISSIKNQKIIVCIQRNIQIFDDKMIEAEEKEIIIDNGKAEKIYNELIVFIIKVIHNQ